MNTDRRLISETSRSFSDERKGMSEEEWRPVVGYEGSYEVSDLGRVRSLPRNGTRREIVILRAFRDCTGYHRVNLRRIGIVQRGVHQLVAAAFIGPRPKGMMVCHWDGDCGNAALENLRYGTAKENAADRQRHGKYGKLSLREAREIKLLGRRMTQSALGEKFGVSRSTIRRYLRSESYAIA